MTQSNNPHEANGKRNAQSHLTRARKTQFASGLSKTAMIAGLVAAWTMIGEATVPSYVAAQEQPPLPPVTVESPTPRPRAATQPTVPATTTRAKRAARRTNRTATRPNPTNAPVTANVAPPPPAPPKEGSEAAGYKPETVSNFGPFGKKPILDVPYSINVISSDLIENKLASTSDDVFKLSPVVQTYFPTGASHGSGLGFNLRGFQQSAIAEDGLRTNSFYPMALEDKERVEIYTGLTSFLFGPTNVGGLVNYVYKRPTDTPLANITVGDYGNLQGFAHADLGGPIDKEGMFGYRLNIVEQHGKTPINDQGLDKQLVTGAIDWHIAPGTTLGVMGTYEKYDLHAFSTYWNYTAVNGASPFNYRWAPNPSQNYSPTYSSLPYEVARAEVNLTSKLNDIFTARLAYSFTNVYFGSYYGNLNYLTSNTAGTYTQKIWYNTPTDYQTNSAYGFLDMHFFTGPVEHKLTTGYYGNNISTQYGAGSASPTTTTTGLSLYNISYPYYSTPPNTTSTLSYYNTPYIGSVSAQNNFVLGDDIKLNEFLSALVGANQATIITKNYNATPPFAISSAYNKSELTPSLSLIFKPIPWLSVYATYSEALEQGQIVPTTPNYTNAGQILPPFLDHEYELGAKADIHGLFLTAAFFQINKANQYALSNPNGTLTYVQDGREVHSGFELTATGKLTDELRIIGGLTLMDARVLQTASILTNDKYPMNVANQLAKGTAEYDIPFVPGLTLTGGIYYVGKQAADPVNSVWLPSYVTEDLGLRYRSKLPSGQEVIFRLNASNIANTAYWQSTYAAGAPRTIAMSTEIKF